MTDWMDLTNFTIAFGGLMVGILGLFLALISPYAHKQQKKFFVVLFIILILYISSDITSQISLILLDSNYTNLSRLSVFCESLFSSILMVLMTLYILDCSKNQKRNLHMNISVFIWFIYFILLVITQFTKGIYYFTDDNVYHRGIYYPVLLLPIVVLSLYNVFILFVYRKAFSKRQLYAFILYLSIPIICMLIQMFSYGLLLTVIGTSIASIIMFIFILYDQIAQYINQRELSTKQQASLLALEMRPHFIYNTLTSVYYLCKQDPEKAQQVILDFNTYLRKNFTAMTSENLILFEDELAHTKAYLAVEKVRFEGMLFVKYDTPITKFRIPPLTLQPLVENAVKHGMDPELEPLQIDILTRETDEGFEIIVEDNGSGFDNTEITYNDDPHIALNNIKERLSLMCNAKMTIAPNDKGGTTVTIFIHHKNT
ncbi:MAG: histidine kinase [Lachnospiraceae bacterium]|nr:histidine kinase [Lachnospiraceae bacterium]